MKKPRKSQVQRMCAKHGLDERELILYCEKTFSCRKEAANYLEITYEWYNKLCQNHGIRCGLDRQHYKTRLDKFNLEHNTDFSKTSDAVRWLSDGGMSKKEIVKALGVSIKTVYSALGDLSNPYNNSFNDERKSNLTEKWTDPDHAPCKKCKWERRSKFHPGCVKCDRRVEYALLTAGLPAGGNVYEPANCQIHSTFKEYSQPL